MDPPPAKKAKIREGSSSRPTFGANPVGSQQHFNCRVRTVDSDEIPPYVSTYLPLYIFILLNSDSVCQPIVKESQPQFPNLSSDPRLLGSLVLNSLPVHVPHLDSPSVIRFLEFLDWFSVEYPGELTLFVLSGFWSNSVLPSRPAPEWSPFERGIWSSV